MNTESQPPKKSDLQNPSPSPMVPQAGMSQPPWMPGYPPNEEIDLVDIGVMLWRRRRLMAWVAGVLIALALLLAIFKKPTYDYTTSIQLGSMLTQTGTLVPLMSPQTATGTLQNTNIPNAIYQYEAQQHVNLRALKINVGSHSDSTTVTLTCKVSGKLSAACVAVEKAAAGNFVRDNTRAMAAVRASLKAQVDAAKLNLVALQDPTVFGVQKLAAEKAIADARNALANLQASATVLKVRQSKLHASVDLYQKEAAQLQTHITDVRKAAISAAQGTASPTEAMANLILSTEEQRSVDLYNTIQHKLTVALPEQSATVDKDLADNTRAQTLQKQVIAQNRLALQKLLFDHGQQIQNQQISIDNLESQLNNIQDNRVLGDPLRSLTPVGLGRIAILAIGIVLSVFIALIAALFAGYVEQVRARLAAAKNT
ncbi:MAG: Wzz/FepE/Etk N-terminal domain-containing protein [Gammaproteobacteria bacterium]